MERILVGVDGSPCSLRAVELAARLAARFPGVELTLLAALSAPLVVAEEMEVYARAEHLRMAELLAVMREVRPGYLVEAVALAERLNAPRVRPVVESGDPANLLIEHAERSPTDLIVVGRRGRGRLAGLLIGSVSQKLVTHAPCPVLVAS